MSYRIEENSNKVRVYTASKFENYKLVREVNDIIRDEGWGEITYDWTLTDEFDKNGNFLGFTRIPEERRKLYAYKDKRGVMTADALIFIADKDGRGAYWECGLADAKGIPIVVVNPSNYCIFYEGDNVIVVDNITEAINHVRALVR